MYALFFTLQRSSINSVYFSEDVEEAQKAVTETLDFYDNLLKKLSTDQKKDVLRTIGLKIEELKAQQEALIDDAKHWWIFVDAHIRRNLYIMYSKQLLLIKTSYTDIMKMSVKKPQ